MKVKLTMLTMDPFIDPTIDVSPQLDMMLTLPDPLLDGPVSRRVAILDFDDQGALRPGVPLVKRGQTHQYEWGQSRLFGRRLPMEAAKRARLAHDRDMLRSVSVFGLVHKVLALFEGPEGLGRKIDWAFPGEQLLVVPRAGDWANAYYERATRSLQFFSFRPTDDADWVHTADSPDIVVHETAHAVLDGIAPDLYDSVTPEALAIHEAVADLTAIFVNIGFRRLVDWLLTKVDNDLRTPTVIGTIAEQFGDAINAGGGQSHLRSIYTAKTLDSVAPEPHALSEVLSSAVWDALVLEYERLATVPWQGEELAQADADADANDGATDAGTPAADEGAPGTPGQRLWKAAFITRRVLFRALDYLPPGDCNFADLARAMFAADIAAYPDDPYWRQGLAGAVVKRGIVADVADLQPLAPLEPNPLEDCDLAELEVSDWAAYRFVESHRQLFCIPEGVAFEVRPRLSTEKRHYVDGKGIQVRELIFKVTWWRTEANEALQSVALERRIRRGATVVVACDEPLRPIRVRLTNDPAFARDPEAEDARGRAQRDRFLANLLAAGKLAPTDEAGQDEVRRMGLAPVTAIGGVMRLRQLGAMLHMLETDHDHGAGG